MNNRHLYVLIFFLISFSYSYPGCTDSEACNFNTEADIDDGSCTYVDGVCDTCVNGLIVDNDIDNDGLCNFDDPCPVDPLNLIDADGICIGEAPQTYVPDDNFENYLELNGMGNGIIEDDYVFTANINLLEILDISGLDIEDLTGIEDFASLVSFNFSNNLISDVDLTQNLSLYNFSGSYNSIENLIFSNSVSAVECDNNNLSEIDLSENQNLTYLDCSYIQLN